MSTTPQPQLVPLADLVDLTRVFGLGVAGNFAGHLEQAGEAADFTNVAAAASMPKGIFPWYAPGAGTFLDAFPLSSDTLVVPDPAPGDPAPNIQIEPEVGMLAGVTYDADGAVTELTPIALAAFDDCSIRRDGATKISHKKNWGTASKGVAARAFSIGSDGLAAAAEHLQLASFLLRDGELHPYGVDSAVATYSLFGDDLLTWLVDRLRSQRASTDTPLEDVGELLRAAGRPAHVLVGVGATRYEPFGEVTFLEPGDEAIVAVYDSRVHTGAEVVAVLSAGRDSELAYASVLRRRARS